MFCGTLDCVSCEHSLGWGLDSGLIETKTVNMPNITVSVDDEVYHRARVRAAEQRTSISAIVRRMLSDIASEETRDERLKRMEQEAVERIASRGVRFSGEARLSRDELHERHAIH